MRKGKFTEDQIIGILKEHQAGMLVADMCRKHGVSDATFYGWRSRDSGMEVLDSRGRRRPKRTTVSAATGPVFRRGR